VTLLWVGLIASVLGGGVLVFRRPLTAWNARGADAMRSEHVRRVTESSDGYPGYVVGIGALVLVLGVVLAVIGAGRL
jgi:TRAP-type uncharacterized transport system fused permease subunit